MKRASYDPVFKCWDWQNAQYFCGPAATVDLPTGAFPTPATGSSFYQRVGNRIIVTGFHWRSVILPSRENDAPAPDQYCRLMVVYDKQWNGRAVAPPIDEILQIRQANGVAQIRPLGGTNVDWLDRFEVLMDEFYAVPQIAPYGASSTNDAYNVDLNGMRLEKCVEGLHLPITFKGNTTSPSDVATGGLFLVSLSSHTIPPALPTEKPAWICIFDVRFHFQDQ